MATRRRRRSRFGLVWRGILAVIAAILLVFVALFAIDTVAPPISTLMLARSVEGRGYDRRFVPLASISPVLVASVIASEDARFCRNDGVDWDSLHQVIDQADADGPSRGASTITMQTAKNLFLWPGRSAIRKGIEIVMALGLDRLWSKAHTIEVYLNIAEWGDGIFGIEAAAQHYFHKSAARLDARESALLATSLPNPIERDASDPEPFQRKLAATLVVRARGSEEWLDCLPRR